MAVGCRDGPSGADDQHGAGCPADDLSHDIFAEEVPDPLAFTAAHDDEFASFLQGDLCNLVMDLAFFEPRLLKNPFGPGLFPDFGNRPGTAAVQDIFDIPDAGKIQVPIIFGNDLDDGDFA